MPQAGNLTLTSRIIAVDNYLVRAVHISADYLMRDEVDPKQIPGLTVHVQLAEVFDTRGAGRNVGALATVG